MEPALLLARISEAFPETPIPNMTLQQAQLADQSLAREISDKEWDEVGSLDRSLLWTQISDEQILPCDAALSHFDEDSFVYYLPAFLSFAVRHAHVGITGDKGTLMNFIIFAVTEFSNYNLSRLKRLSEIQIACVVDFLRFFSERSECYKSDAAKALTTYWLTPDAHRKTIILLPEA